MGECDTKNKFFRHIIVLKLIRHKMAQRKKRIDNLKNIILSINGNMTNRVKYFTFK